MQYVIRTKETTEGSATADPEVVSSRHPLWPLYVVRVSPILCVWSMERTGPTNAVAGVPSAPERTPTPDAPTTTEEQQ